MRPGKALSYHNPDSAVELPCFPMPLLQYLLMKRREAKIVLIAIFIHI